jgi:hypothetical protein
VDKKAEEIVSISAMKQAVKALEYAAGLISPITKGCQCQICLAHTALRQAIAEAEKQEPVAWIVDGEIKVRLDMAGKLYYSETNVYEKDVVEQAIQQEPVAFVSGYTNGECVVMPMNPAVVFSVGMALYTAPVHASDISQERVDETAKDRHEWVGLDDDIPGLGLVTEEFYNGMLCAEDILRRRNT